MVFIMSLHPFNCPLSTILTLPPFFNILASLLFALWSCCHFVCFGLARYSYLAFDVLLTWIGLSCRVVKVCVSDNTDTWQAPVCFLCS